MQRPERMELSNGLSLTGLQQRFNSQTKTHIPKLWQQFVPLWMAIPQANKREAYGVCLNVTPEGEFDYLCGIELPETVPVPAEFSRLSLPPRRYAVFRHDLHVSELSQTFQAACAWHAETQLGALGEPCFERYTADYNPETGFGGTEVWFPLA